MKKFASLFFSVLMVLSLTVPASALSASALESAVQKSADWMLDRVKEPSVSSTGGEWAVIGLARSGCAVPQAYWDAYYQAVETYAKKKSGVLHAKKYTEYSRVILALTAIGADPSDVAGYDLLEPLGDFEKTVWQGINGPIWALIALDSGNYEIPVNEKAATQAIRQMYVDEILSRQLEDGGWNLKSSAASSDPDVTGMALQALAKYQGQTKVKIATEKALACLSGMQDADGGYASWGTSSSESVVQVIVALCELGISLDDKRFVKNGNTLLDNLMSYRQTDGSFLHTSGGTGSNQMASEQGFYGIVAALRAAEGKSSLYCMDDVAASIAAKDADGAGLPGKSADIQVPAVSAPSVTFADITGHENRAAVEALASRGVINGYTADYFGPADTMTRAQFAAVVVRALGLPQQTTTVFLDVSPGDWCAAYVGTAYAYGIVNGTTATTFTPNGTITRQQAAAMVARAAKLCGMDTELEDYEILNTLAQFGDYVTVGEWARESVAFCYAADILDQSDLNVEPQQAILRCEVAQMLYNLLDAAKLL